MLRNFFIIVVVVFALGAYFWISKKPQPAPPVANQVMAYSGMDKADLTAKFGRVLIVYYSYGGITREIAEQLQARTGADLYALQLEEDYPDTTMLYISSKKQLYANHLPELQQIEAQLADYELVLVGSPVWWYTVPPPMRSFLAQTDFQGKNIAAFCTQGGNEGTYFNDFDGLAKNATILAGLNLKLPRGQDATELEGLLQAWLEELALKN